MPNKWFILACIKVTETNYKKWLKSEVKTTPTIDITNQIDDPLLLDITKNYIPDQQTPLQFFSEESTISRLSNDQDLLKLHYNYINNEAEFAIILNTVSDKNLILYLNITFTLSKFKEINNLDKIYLFNNEKNYMFNIKDKLIKYDGESYEQEQIYNDIKKVIKKPTYKLIHRTIYENIKNYYTLQGLDIIDFDVDSSESKPLETLYFTDNNIIKDYLGNILHNIDIKSFQILGYKYSKDINHIYYGNQIIKADKESFNISKWGYAYDMYNIFYEGTAIYTNDNIIPSTVINEPEGYIIYNNNLYFRGKLLSNFNTKKLNIISDKNNYINFLSDGKNILYEDKVIKDIDPEKFRYLNYSFFTDEKNIYHYTTILKVNDINSIKIFNEYYILDKVNIIFIYGDIINYIAIKDFNNIPNELLSFTNEDLLITIEKLKQGNNQPKETIKPTDIELKNITTSSGEPSNYYTDNNTIYYKNNPLNNINPSEFKQYKYLELWEDGKNIIDKDIILKDIDYSSFKHINYNFYQDKSNLYFRTFKLININPNKVTILTENYITDNEYFYFIKDEDGEIIFNKFQGHFNSIDILSENNNFAIDINNIYFQGNIIKEINISKSELLEYNYIADDSKIFYGNILIHQYNQGYNFTPYGEFYTNIDGIIFFKDKNIGNNINSFYVLGNQYATDGIKFWFKGNIVAHPESNTFLKDILGSI